MNPNPLTVPYSIYRLFMDDIYSIRHRLNEIADSAIEKAALRHKNVHRIEQFNWHDKKFFCEVQVTETQTCCIAYRVVLHDKGFYSMAYNHSTHDVYHFKPHFFERYNERLELDIAEAERLMTHYLHHNGFYTVSYKFIKEKRFYPCQAKFKTGIGYGLYDSRQQTYYFRTFISYEKMGFRKKVQNNLELSAKEIISELSKKFAVKGKGC